METTTVLRDILGVIAFPLTAWNLAMNQLNKEMGISYAYNN
ncbi:hypothetical protein [Psychrobacillus sp. NPDC093180]